MDTKEKTKRKNRGKGCLIGLIIVLAVLAIAGGIGWSLIAKEHREAGSLPLDAVDFDKLSDGTYHGAYAGGMYKWRTNVMPGHRGEWQSDRHSTHRQRRSGR